MSKEALDELETVARRIPILDKLEVDKLVAFIKLLFVEPLVGLGLAVTVITAFFYSSYPRTETLIVLIAIIALFIYILFERTKVIIALKRLQLEYERLEKRRIDVKNIMEEWTRVLESREAMRTKWLNGYRHIQIDKMGIHWDYFESVLGREDIDAETKISVMSIVMEELKNIRAEYQKMLPAIDSDYKDFVTGIEPPPSTSDASLLTELEGIIQALERINPDG